MKTQFMRATAGALVIGLMASQQAIAATALWDVNVDPTNGFGGLTATWGLTDADTAYAEWVVFDSLSDSTPDAGSFGPAPQSVTETTGGAFLTGGGNIYSFAVATDFDVVLSGHSAISGNQRTLALRLATVGTDVDTASVLLDGVAPSIFSNAYNEVITGGFGGAENEYLFIWNNIEDSLSYQFDFNALGSSMSLDQLAVYSSAASVVPVPAAVWLFGSALAGLGGMVRRRSRQS